MIHFVPESAVPAEISAPYAEAVARLAGLRHALGIVDPQARHEPLFDEQRLAASWHGAGRAAQRCFDRRSTQATATAAAGLEALLGARDSGGDANPVVRQRIADEIRAGLEDLSRLMRA